jgi:hypothetical protein
LTAEGGPGADGSGADLAAVARELYALDPTEFTAARADRVSETRRAGDRETAAEIKTWKRPSPSAWAINLLAQERGDDVALLLDLGARLREAQASLSGDDLRRLARQRHQVIAALAREAGTLTADRGRPINDPAARQVEETLGAALADPQAAQAVASGRLVRPLQHQGLGPVELEGAVAGPAVEPPQPAETPPPAARRPASGPELEAARARFAGAEEAVRHAAADLEEAEAAHRAAQQQQTEADAEVARLERQLAAAQREAGTATTHAEHAGRSWERAQEPVDAARERAEEARQELAALEDED